MAVFGQLEQQIKSKDPFKLLEQCIYLTEEECYINPKTISIRQIKSGSFLTEYSDIKAYADQENISLEESCKQIMFENNVFSDCKVVVSEDTVIYDPSILNKLSNVIIRPISDSDPIYQLVESIVEEMLETGNESLLEELTSDQVTKIDDLYNKHKERIDKKIQDAEDAFQKSKWAQQYNVQSRRIQNMKDDLEKNRSKMSDIAIKNKEKRIRTDTYLNEKWKENALKKLGIKSINKEKSMDKLDAAKERLSNYTDKKNQETEKANQNTNKYTSFAQRVKASIIHYKDESKAYISKKIASLRKIYDNWMNKIKSLGNNPIVQNIKRGCEIILKAIGVLLNYQETAK